MNDNVEKLLLSKFEGRLQALNDGKLELFIAPLEGQWKRVPNTITHFYTEIFFQIAGKTTFKLYSSEIELLPNQILIMPTGVPHGEVGSHLDGEFDSVVITPLTETIHCHDAILRWIPDDSTYIPSRLNYTYYPIKANQLFDSIVKHIMEISLESSTRQETVDSLVKTMLTCTLELGRRTKNDEDQGINEPSSKTKLVQQYVQLNLHEQQLSVASIAKDVGLASDYLAHKYHIETKEKLTQYINRLRISQAEIFLKETNMNVSEIAWACGYKDIYYFSRVFKKTQGMSPSKYRATSQGLKNDTLEMWRQ